MTSQFCFYFEAVFFMAILMSDREKMSLTLLYYYCLQYDKQILSCIIKSHATEINDQFVYL